MVPDRSAGLIAPARFQVRGVEHVSVYADAVAAGHPAIGRLLFDVAEVARTGRAFGPDSAAVMQRMVSLMRKIGIERMLYGSDPAVFGRLAPREGWAKFRSVMPPTDGEIEQIANNVAPYIR